MIYLTKTIGQLSNQIWQHIEFDVFCTKNNLKHTNLCFYKILAEYQDISIKNRFFIMCLAPIIEFMLKVLDKIHMIKILDLNDEKTIKNILKNGVKKNYFVKGFNFYKNEEFSNYVEKYKSFFLCTKNKNTIDSLYDEKFRNFSVILGLHIRHGDYKTFQNGKYYYTNDQYSNLVTNFCNSMGISPKSVFVVIFSNDRNIDQDLDFSTKDINYTVSHSNVADDYYLMTKCDYLIGPPSTFTMLTSFLGQVPLFVSKTGIEKNLNGYFKIYNKCENF